MKTIKYIALFFLFACILPVASSCRDDDDKTEVPGGYSQLYKQIVGTWRCHKSYIVSKDATQREQKSDFLMYEKIQFKSDGTYYSSSSVLGKAGTYKASSDAVMLNSEDGGSNAVKVEYIDNGKMFWKFKTEKGNEYRLEFVHI